MSDVIKTRSEWRASGLCLSQYLHVGDSVDAAIKDYFLTELHPAFWNGTILQMGEPYSSVQGFPTFATLKKVANEWVYTGNCHLGETKEPCDVMTEPKHTPGERVTSILFPSTTTFDTAWGKASHAGLAAAIDEITAAPELLAALRDVFEDGLMTNMESWRKKARTAITKAEGRAEG
jgi:hypothetical protein